MQNPTQPSGEWQHVSSGNSGETPTAPGYNAQPSSYPSPGQSGPTYNQAPVASQSEGLSDNAAAAISYITIIPAILFLVMDPYKRIPLVRFHAMQCLFFNAAVFACYVIFGMLWSIVVHIVPLLAIVGLLLWPVMGLAFMVIWGFCVFKASQGAWFKLPILGDFAMKQTNS
jgi:uncharacterized membrane protein